MSLPSVVKIKANENLPPVIKINNKTFKVEK